MTNPYYNHTSPVLDGTTADAADLNTEFDAIAAGFDAINTGVTGQITVNTAPGVTAITENAANRANKVVGFAANGDVQAQPGVGRYRGLWVTATQYYVRDVVRDNITKNLYICDIQHVSAAALSTDVSAARFLILVDVTQLQVDTSTGALIKGNNLSDLTSVPTARSNLGLDTLATQSAAGVVITGGTISGITDLAIADGGTGASTASVARTNLGLGTLATLGTINNSNWSGTALALANGGTAATTAAGARTSLELGSLATLSAVDNANWSGTALAVSNGGTAATTAAAARTNLGLGSLATLSTINNSNWSGAMLAVLNGGTGASDTPTARTNLGLGTIATQAANNVNITGGTITGSTISGGSVTGITDLTVADGGTGASTAAAARTNLGLDFQGALVVRTADANITDNLITQVIWQAETYDVGNFWVSATPTQLIVPAGVTRVRVSAGVSWASNSTGSRLVRIDKNGAAFAGRAAVRVPAQGNSEANLTTPAINVVAGDYFELSVLQSSGATLALQWTGENSWFAIEVIR